MYQVLYIFVKGSEVNYEPEFSALLRHKARRSTKLRLFIGFHPPYNPLRFQLRQHSSGLRFDVQRDRSWFETIEHWVTGSVGEIFDRDTH